MKIVNRKEFLKLPSNTLYSKYKPCCFGELSIKYETGPYDFYCNSLNDVTFGSSSDETYDKLLEIQDSGESIPIDLNCIGRDGLFEEDQLFAVYDNNDVEHIINKLKECIK